MLIGEKLELIYNRIERSAIKAGRNPADVKLLAISKTHPTESVLEAYNGGQTLFGENRVKEAEGKIDALPRDISWHLVGHLQRNKARIAVKIFDLIHSVDSIRLLKEISRRAAEIGKIQDYLIQLNISGENTKFGLPENQLSEMIKTALGLSNVRLRGFMTIPPFLSDLENVRPFFRRLREISEEMSQFDSPKLSKSLELSMGMSHDFEVAIEEGATIVRVGTAIFGTRDYGGLT